MKVRYALLNLSRTLLLLGLWGQGLKAQDAINSLTALPEMAPGRYHYLLEMGTNTYGQPIEVPVIVLQGATEGPSFGLVAAIHGNELNGIPVIFKVLEKIDVATLQGRIIAIPGINAVSIEQDRRRFPDEEDLNRNFPGKAKGNRSQQYTYKISNRMLRYFDYLVDLHTASFGRVNSYYVRAGMDNDTLARMAVLQGADIILDSSGEPSTGDGIAGQRTLRAEALSMNIPAITIECGNPQVFQPEIEERGIMGILRTLQWLKMVPESGLPGLADNATRCSRSYWIYMEEGGFLETLVDLREKVAKGQKIARVRNGFGELISEYVAPEAGIVIGKSSNPSNMSGGRIIHLGIPSETQ